MCEPLTIAAIAAQGAGTGLSLYQQRENAKALEEHQDLLHKENSKIARDSAILQFDQLQRRTAEESEAAARELDLGSRRAQAERGRAVVTAAERGTVGSQSFDTILTAFEAREGLFRSTVKRNFDLRRRQLELEKLGVNAQRHGRMLSTLPQPVPRPDYFGAALGFVGSALSLGASTSASLNSNAAPAPGAG